MKMTFLNDAFELLKRFWYGAFEFEKFLLESVIVPLGWPILILVGLLLFRHQIADLISELESFGNDGIRRRASPQKATIDDEGSLNLKGYAPNVVVTSGTDGEGDDQSFEKTHKENFRIAIQQAPDSQRPWVEDAQREVLATDSGFDKNFVVNLILAYASVRRIQFFEIMSRNVYLTQYQALKALIDIGGHTEHMLREHLDDHISKSKGAVYKTVQSLMNFLVSQSLVASIEGRYEATQRGIDFVDYVRTVGIDEQSFRF